MPFLFSDRKTWDDVSPEVDEDAWCEDETLSCPQTPSSNYSARSATATPIKPVAWMSMFLLCSNPVFSLLTDT